MAWNTSLDLGVNDDGKVNQECLKYVLGEFPLRTSTHDGSWSKEPQVQLQARMATYTSDSLKVSALQHGFHRAWLQAFGLSKDMSLISDDMGQAIELDNRSVLPPYTWPSDKAFPGDANYGYPTHDLSFVDEGQWAEFPYLWRIEDLPYLGRYKCTAGSSDMKPKFGMYFGVPSHEEYGLLVTTMEIIQGGIHSDGVHTIYAQEVKDSEGTFHWTTTKTCAWCNHVISNAESAMNHMRTDYRIVLVCPFCAIWGSHSYPSMRDHVKKCKGDHSWLLVSSDTEPGKYEPCFC